MKRLLPALIAVSLIIGVFFGLSGNGQGGRQPRTLDELDGCNVGIQTGLNYEDYLGERCPGAKPVFFSEFPSMMPALQQGKVDAILTETTSFTVEKLENPGLAAMDEPLMHVECGIGVSDDGMGRSLLGQLNEFISLCKRDGTREQMMDYWFDHYDRDNTSVDRSGITGENGVINITSEASYEPVCFIGKGGQLQGYDIDFIYRFCRKYGYEPNITPLEYDAMAAALAGGRCSVAMGLIANEERSEEVNFTGSYISYDVVAVYSQDTGEDVPFLEGLKNSFTKTFIRDDRWKMFLQGAGTTLLISGLSILFGTILGLLLYLWVANGKEAEKNVTAVISWIAGSTPTVVLLMVLYYIVFRNYSISNVAVSVVGFTIVFGCSFYEEIRTGVKAVGTGQEEAARSQGFTANQTFFRIIFPQALAHLSSGYQSDAISLIQDTSVVGYIAVMDLTKMSDLIRGRTYEAFFPLLATAVIYYLLIMLVTVLLGRAFALMDNRHRAKTDILKGITPVGTAGGKQAENEAAVSK